MIIGEIIVDLRKDRNYTQKELAGLLNISAGCLSKYENGTTQPPLEMLIQISDVLNVSTDYLLGRNNFEFDYNKLNTSYIKSINGFTLLNEMLKLNRENRTRLLDYLNLLKKDMALNKLIKQK